MSSVDQASEKAKALASIKEYVERRLEELRSEIAILEKLKAFIDEELAGLSFRKAAETKPPEKAEAVEKVERVRAAPEKPPPGRVRVLRSKTGELLAKVVISGNEIRFIVDPKINLPKESRPFQSFLLRKVLEAMSRTDKERVEKGLIPPGHELEYEIIYEGDRVREIIVRNFREEYRLREIVNAVRWTLETVAG
ncbi:MAG: hypothetical protein J7L17_02250 [Thaumarchaeota archaeon]|nr:hypothetical protein [Nitrososphaerota archaeon]